MIKGIIVGVIAFILLVSVIGAINSKGSTVEGITLSQAENVCQDANFLQNYVDIKDVSVVTLNYKPVFIDQKDGTKYISWYGKQDSTDTVISFECVVHKVNDKIEVKSLTIDGQAIFNK